MVHVRLGGRGLSDESRRSGIFYPRNRRCLLALAMVTFRLTRADQDDVWTIVARGGPKILVGQRMVFCPSLGEDPGLFEVYSYDWDSHTYTLQDPATRNRLRSHPFPSSLYVREGSRQPDDPILAPLAGLRLSTSPYLIRLRNRLPRGASPCSPARGFDKPRRAPPSPRRAASPITPLVSAPFPGVPPAMGPAALLSSPLTRPRGPVPGPGGPGGPAFAPGFAPPPYWGPPGFMHPPGFPLTGGPSAGPGFPPPLPAGPPPHPLLPARADSVWDPALEDLRSMVEQLQSETKDLRSSGHASSKDLLGYAVAFARKLHGAISIAESPGLHSQMSMGLEIAVAPRAQKSLLALGQMCSTDIKDIDMRFSWIGDGIFNETNAFCEAEGENLSPEQIRAIERKIISLHRQQRAKAFQGPCGKVSADVWEEVSLTHLLLFLLALFKTRPVICRARLFIARNPCGQFDSYCHDYFNLFIALINSEPCYRLISILSICFALAWPVLSCQSKSRLGRFNLASALVWLPHIGLPLVWVVQKLTNRHF